MSEKQLLYHLDCLIQRILSSAKTLLECVPQDRRKTEKAIAGAEEKERKPNGSLYRRKDSAPFMTRPWAQGLYDK